MNRLAAPLLHGARRARRQLGTRSDWWLWLRAGGSLLGTLLLLRMGLFARLLQVPAAGGELDQAAACRLAGYVDGWLRWLRLSRPCLPRSLCLYRGLRRAGWPVALNLGIRSPSGPRPFEGHAWLSLDDVPFLEPQPERIGEYLPVFSSLRHRPDAAGAPARVGTGWCGD